MNERLLESRFNMTVLMRPNNALYLPIGKCKELRQHDKEKCSKAKYEEFRQEGNETEEVNGICVE